jgi:hypothetical protein
MQVCWEAFGEINGASTAKPFEAISPKPLMGEMVPTQGENRLLIAPLAQLHRRHAKMRKFVAQGQSSRLENQGKLVLFIRNVVHLPCNT